MTRPEAYAGPAKAFASPAEELEWRTEAIIRAIESAEPAIEATEESPDEILAREKPEWTDEQRTLFASGIQVLRSFGWQLRPHPKPVEDPPA